MKKEFNLVVLLVLIGLFPIKMYAWEGMPTPPLHVEGRFLKDPGGNNVLIHGWMQAIETWFNGEGYRYDNPTDWNDPNNVAGMLNFLNDAATEMSDPNPKYGRDHGWYTNFVRINTDFIGGWTQENGLENASQFNGWIQNFIVPYANHLSSRGLYLIICATGPINTPNNGTNNAGIVEQQRLRTFWSTVANHPDVKNADNIMFELMNEPVNIESSPGNGDWGHGSDIYWQAFRDWIQPVINDIRNTGANNVIWVPTLNWQGEAQGWAEYPFTGSNIGVAAHLYPGYGGCHDNVTCIENLWNSHYKPAADNWPMIITEMMWFPYDGDGYNTLFNATTDGFGNAVKNEIDNQGNVSYLVGFLGDHLVDLRYSEPADCNLGSYEGTQAFFSWLPTYAWAAPATDDYEPPADGCTGVTSLPDGIYSITARHSGRCLDVYNFSTSDGGNIVQWDCGEGENQQWIASQSNGRYTFRSVHSDKCLDVAGGSSADGANIQQWECLGVDAQSFCLQDAGDGYYTIVNYGSGKLVDIEGVSTDNGANVHQWTSTGGQNQQFMFTPVGDAPPSDNYYQLRNRTTGLYVDGYGRTSNGANLAQHANTTHQNSQWTIENVGNGYVKFKNRATGLYIDGMGRTSNGDDVGQWANTDHHNTHWLEESTGDGYFRYTNRATGLYLDGMGRTSNGDNVGQWANTNHHNAHWSKSAINEARIVEALDLVNIEEESALDMAKKVMIYPNPVTDDRFKVELNGLEGESLIRILNIRGKLVQEQQVKDVNVVDMQLNAKAGIYFIHVINNNHNIVKKIILK